MASDKSTTPRACLGCGVSLEGTHPNRKRCQACVADLDRIRKLARDVYRKKRIELHGERRCRECGVSLEDSTRKRIWCRPCAKKRRLERQHERQQTPEHKEYMKKWAACRRKMPGIKERERELRQQYYRSPGVRERLLAYAKRPEQVQRQRERQQTPEHKAYMRAYRKSPEFKNRSREYARLRKPWDSTVTAESVAAMLDAQHGMCVACKENIRNGYEMDHIVPLSKGGPSRLANLQLLCQTCNRMKHAKDPYEFAMERGRLFI